MDHIQYDSYRYANWALFVLAAAVNSVPTQAFSGVTPIITRVYELTQFEANIPSFIFPLAYIFLLIPANYILDKKGLKLGTLICQICMIIGLLVRLMINVHYYLFCLGTVICSLGFCFMLSGANEFANVWFPHHQIFLVSSICVFAIFTSDAIGTVLSSLFIREQSSKEDIFTFFLWQSLAMVAIHIAMAIFFRGKPKHMQNYASVSKRNPFIQDLKAIIHNKNYRVLFLCTSFVFCAVSIIYVFIPWISKTYGFETQANGYFIVSANAGGCIGCVLIGIWTQTMPYTKKIRALSFCSVPAISLLWLAFQLKYFAFCCASAALYGFMCYPLLTTLTDFATQTTFPVGEASSSGILLFGGQISGVILSVIFSFIFNGQSLKLTRMLNGIIVFLLVMGFIVTLFSEQILQRQKYQNQHQKSALLQECSLNNEQNQTNGKLV